MADETMRTTLDPAIDGALERFERAEAELEETDERRRQLADQAARAAADLEAVLGESIAKVVATRDRLEEELAVVQDHLGRLESMRARSAGGTTSAASAASTASTVQVEHTIEVEHTIDVASEDEDDEPAVDQWDQLLRSRDDDTAVHLVSEDLSTDR